RSGFALRLGRLLLLALAGEPTDGERLWSRAVLADRGRRGRRLALRDQPGPGLRPERLLARVELESHGLRGRVVRRDPLAVDQGRRLLLATAEAPAVARPRHLALALVQSALARAAAVVPVDDHGLVADQVDRDVAVDGERPDVHVAREREGGVTRTG